MEGELWDQQKDSANEDMDKVIKIEGSLEKSGLLNDGTTETVKYERKNKDVDFLVLRCHLCMLHW